MSPTNTKLDLINKLLAKAANTPYPAEAQAFQEHAERLMIRYGVEKAQLDAERAGSGRVREEIVERKYPLTGVYRRARLDGLVHVARCMDTTMTLQSKSATAITLHVVGAQSDVEQLLRLFDSLLQQVNHAMISWWAGVSDKSWMTEQEKRTERRQFQLSFFYSVGSRLRTVVSEESAGSELVLAGRRQRAEDKARELYPQMVSGRSRRLAAGSYAAGLAGSRAGQTADVFAGKVAGRGAAGGLTG